MATTATLTYDLTDLIGVDFDPRRTKVWVTANVPLIVVDGTTIRLDNAPTQTPASDGTGSFTLVTTNSAVNPTSFAYTFHVDYALKGNRQRKTLDTSEFSFTASANLAAIDEAFDNLTIAPTWRATFLDQAEQLLGIEDTDDAVAYQMQYGTASSAYLAKTYSPVFTPKAYGAVEDGVVDDTTAMQAALTAARTAKGTLQLKAGATYLIAATLNPAGVTIDGRGATIKQKAGVTAFPMLQATTAPVVIRDITLDGNRANTTSPSSIDTNGTGIYVFRSSGGDMGLVQNVTAVNLWGPAIRVGSTRFTDPRDNNKTAGVITGLRASNCGVGVFLDAARDVKISGSQFLDVDRQGVQDNNGCNNSVTACTVDGTKAGYGIITQYSYGFAAIGNSVRRTGTAMTIGSGLGATGIQLGGGDVTYNVAKGFTISNNLIEDCFNYGISLDPTLIGSPGVVQVTPGTVSGNVISSCGIRAFALDNTQNGGSGIFLHQCSQVSCTGNISRSNQYAGIIDDGLDNIVSGNIVHDNPTYGVEVRCGSTETKGRGTLGANNYRGNGTNVSVSQYSLAGDRVLPGDRSAYKTADQAVNNSTTTVFDTHLVFTMVPGTYELSGMLVVDSSAVADFRAAWQVPAGTDLTWTLDAFGTTAASTASPVLRTPVVVTGGSGTVGTATSGMIAAGTLITHLPRGTMKITTAGTVTFRFAQGTAEASDTILKAGSYLSLKRIA